MDVKQKCPLSSMPSTLELGSSFNILPSRPKSLHRSRSRSTKFSSIRKSSEAPAEANQERAKKILFSAATQAGPGEAPSLIKRVTWKKGHKLSTYADFRTARVKSPTKTAGTQFPLRHGKQWSYDAIRLYQYYQQEWKRLRKRIPGYRPQT